MRKVLYVIAAILFAVDFIALLFGFEPSVTTVGLAFLISSVYFIDAAIDEEESVK